MERWIFAVLLEEEVVWNEELPMWQEKHPRFQKEASDSSIILSTGQQQSMQEEAKQPHILHYL